MIWKESKVVADDRFDVFLPLETGIDSTLNKTVHWYSEVFNRILT